MTDQVPEAVQRLAGELADAFEQDRWLAEQLTAAQHRAESVVDAVGAGAAAAEVEAAVLSDLQEVHWAIHRAFSEHQQLSEDRRHLAAEIGELIAAFVSELIAAGWSEERARAADVHQLAAQVA